MSSFTSKFTMTPIKKSDEDEKMILSIPIISDNCRITDSRKLKDFKDQTFGGYNITQASTALDKAIMEDKIEPALHWTLQLFFSGVVNPLWSKLFSFASKQINIYNPKLPEFIMNKTLQWQHIVENSKFTKENVLLLRNHPAVRLLLAEMVAVLVLSKKRKMNQLPKIKKEEFIIDNFKSKLEAKDNRLVENIINNEDPSEIRISINEMAYHIHHNNTNKALYWINWILEWEKINSKKYGKYECASRSIEGVDAKYFKDVVWLIWAVIQKMRKLKCSGVSFIGIGTNGNAMVENEWDRQINCLWKLYINKFTPGARSKKQNLLIWAVLYLTETIDYAVPLIDRPTILFQSMLSFDKIVSNLKSQQVYNVVNSDLINVVVENNFMKPEKHRELEESVKLQNAERLRTQKELLAKQKKINVESMNKLDTVSKLDKLLFA
jgi:hypothetical protein